MVDRGCEAAKVVEEQKNPVDPGLKRVQSVLKAWKGLDLPEEFEMGTCHTVAVFSSGTISVPIALSRLVPKGTMLPLASSASVFGCSEMMVG